MGLKGKLHLWKECQLTMLLPSVWRREGVEGTEQNTGAQ